LIFLGKRLAARLFILCVRFGSVDYLSVCRSRPTGDLFFCVAKKTGQKGEPLHGRAKIPRLFLAHPLKARLAQLFSTNSTKRRQ
jgi:hypothetical protein